MYHHTQSGTVTRVAAAAGLAAAVYTLARIGPHPILWLVVAVAVLGVTSLSAREAAPEHLAGYVRGHWSIENKIHWVRSPGAADLLCDVARSG